jgi:L-serine dehydratase
MKPISIFNDVLGPVMRGPSSSHTAASFQIGRMARALLGDEPLQATFRFDPGGSIAEVYHQQGSDLGFAAGLMGWTITDNRFLEALDHAEEGGLAIEFRVEPLPDAPHPNTIDIQLVSRRGKTLHAVAQSTGGGAIVVTEVDGWPARLPGDAHEILVTMAPASEQAVRELLAQDGPAQDGLAPETPSRQEQDSVVLLHYRLRSSPDKGTLARLAELPGVRRLWSAPPVFFVQRGQPLFGSAEAMVALAQEQGLSLGRIALTYEAALLGLPESEVLTEADRRFEVMRAAVHRGLGKDLRPMQLLRPSARRIYQAEALGGLATGGMHTRAAARAMAVMHVNGGMGVVCAAPTAGAAGTIPGVIVTLAEEKGLDREGTALALLAASAVGLIVAMRATFAAEVAGCQVEIGAAGAMAAAAVVEAAGGSARQATEAAAIAFQNTMGSVCDLVQGIVEIPCHTRNALAASSAFVCADLILGGYENPIPLDETIDAVYAVGKMLPRELKVTALGGLAVTPSALALPRLRQ